MKAAWTQWTLIAVVIGSATISHADPSEANENQARLELGAGAPGGLMAVRYSRVLPTGTRIEPALGLAYTGVLGSILVSQPFVGWTSRSKTGIETTTTVDIYVGYGASHLRDGLHHPLAGPMSFIPNGTYHWLDFGLSLQAQLPWFIVTVGAGVSKLIAGPMGIGGENLDEETFWWLYPEGWLGKHRIVPALWSSVGWSF